VNADDESSPNHFHFMSGNEVDNDSSSGGWMMEGQNFDILHDDYSPLENFAFPFDFTSDDVQSSQGTGYQFTENTGFESSEDIAGYQYFDDARYQSVYSPMSLCVPDAPTTPTVTSSLFPPHWSQTPPSYSQAISSTWCANAPPIDQTSASSQAGVSCSKATPICSQPVVQVFSGALPMSSGDKILQSPLLRLPVFNSARDIEMMMGSVPRTIRDPSECLTTFTKERMVSFFQNLQQSTQLNTSLPPIVPPPPPDITRLLQFNSGHLTPSVAPPPAPDIAWLLQLSGRQSLLPGAPSPPEISKMLHVNGSLIPPATLPPPAPDITRLLQLNGALPSVVQPIISSQSCKFFLRILSSCVINI